MKAAALTASVSGETTSSVTASQMPPPTHTHAYKRGVNVTVQA